MTKYALRVQVIRENIRERDIQVAKIDSAVNCVSHLLANMGRILGLTQVWL
jgi:hypothetical protein